MKKQSIRALLGVCIGLLLLAACVEYISDHSRQCPCSKSHQCCPGVEVCVEIGKPCPCLSQDCEGDADPIFTGRLIPYPHTLWLYDTSLESAQMTLFNAGTQDIRILNIEYVGDPGISLSEPLHSAFDLPARQECPGLNGYNFDLDYDNPDNEDISGNLIVHTDDLLQPELSIPVHADIDGSMRKSLLVGDDNQALFALKVIHNPIRVEPLADESQRYDVCAFARGLDPTNTIDILLKRVYVMGEGLSLEWVADQDGRRLSLPIENEVVGRLDIALRVEASAPAQLGYLVFEYDGGYPGPAWLRVPIVVNSPGGS